MLRFDRRLSGSIAMIVIGMTSIYLGLLVQPATVQPAPPKPAGGGGSNGGGNGGGTRGGGGATDLQPPSTTIEILGRGYSFARSGLRYFSSLTVTLNATDDQTVAHVFLSDNMSSVVLPTLYWSAAHDCAWTSVNITGQGLHVFQYYSVDKAGNKESPHSASAAVGSPQLLDLSNLIANSGIDNAGLQNALLVKVQSAEREQSMGHAINSLRALSNQVSALEGKHGLNKSTADNIRAMIETILAT